LTGSSWLSGSFNGSSADTALAVKDKIAPKRVATTPRTGFTQVNASQIDRETRRSIGYRLCRLRAAVARSRSVAEAAASARDRCTMPPCRCLSRSLVALAVELVHRWDIPLVNLAVAEVGSGCRSRKRSRCADHGTSGPLPLTARRRDEDPLTSKAGLSNGQPSPLDRYRSGPKNPLDPTCLTGPVGQ
jgi:hypothetical protein